MCGAMQYKQNDYVMLSDIVGPSGSISFLLSARGEEKDLTQRAQR